MFLNTKRTERYSNGFTMIELMISIAIVSILASIAIPAYNGYITTAKMKEAHNNLAALRLAEEEYFLENNKYFTGANYTELQSNSGNLWQRAKGSDGYNFSYVVSSTNVTTTWNATATGIAGSVNGKTATASR